MDRIWYREATKYLIQTVIGRGDYTGGPLLIIVAVLVTIGHFVYAVRSWPGVAGHHPKTT